MKTKAMSIEDALFSFSEIKVEKYIMEFYYYFIDAKGKRLPGYAGTDQSCENPMLGFSPMNMEEELFTKPLQLQLDIMLYVMNGKFVFFYMKEAMGGSKKHQEVMEHYEKVTNDLKEKLFKKYPDEANFISRFID